MPPPGVKANGTTDEATPRLPPVLHLVLSAGETSAAYNEHCLPMADKRTVTVVAFFKPTVVPPPGIELLHGRGSVVGFLRTVRAVLRRRSHGVVHVHSPHVGVLLLVAAAADRRTMRRTVFTVHNSYPAFKARNRLLLAACFLGFRRVVCCGRASLESFPAIFKKLAGKRLTGIPNGVDVARIDRVGRHLEPTRAPGPFNVLSVGRLIDVKDPFTMLSAFRQCGGGQARLTMIGDGELKEELERRAAEPGLAGRVELTGLIPREAVFERLLAADLFVSASRVEGLPVAVLEAMACRVPVVLSDIPSHREIAGGESFIALVPPGDPGGFAREIERHTRMSTATRIEIGERCRTLVVERFSLEALQSNYERIYSEVAG